MVAVTAGDNERVCAEAAIALQHCVASILCPKEAERFRTPPGARATRYSKARAFLLDANLETPPRRRSRGDAGRARRAESIRSDGRVPRRLRRAARLQTQGQIELVGDISPESSPLFQIPGGVARAALSRNPAGRHQCAYRQRLAHTHTRLLKAAAEKGA